MLWPLATVFNAGAMRGWCQQLDTLLPAWNPPQLDCSLISISSWITLLHLLMCLLRCLHR